MGCAWVAIAVALGNGRQGDARNALVLSPFSALPLFRPRSLTLLSVLTHFCAELAGGKNGRPTNGEVLHGPGAAHPSSSLGAKGTALSPAEAPKPRENGRALSEGAQRDSRQEGAGKGLGAGSGRAASQGVPSRSQGSVGQGGRGDDERQKQQRVKEELSRRAGSGHTATTGSGSGSVHALSLTSRRAGPRPDEHEAEVMSPRREEAGAGKGAGGATGPGAGVAATRVERDAKSVQERLQQMLHGVLDPVEMCLPEDSDRSLQWLLGGTPGLGSQGAPNGADGSSGHGGVRCSASGQEGSTGQGQKEGEGQGQSRSKGAEERPTRHKWSEAMYLPEFDIHLLPFATL